MNGGGAGGFQPADGQILDQPLLDLVKAGVVLVEDGSGPLQFDVLAAAVGPGDVEHRVEPGPDPVGLHRLVADALQPVDLALDVGGDGLGHELGALDGQFGQLGPVAGDAVTVPLAQLRLNGGQLAAQDGLPLGVLQALRYVALDVTADVDLGQGGSGPFDGQPEPILDLDRL